MFRATYSGSRPLGLQTLSAQTLNLHTPGAQKLEVNTLFVQTLGLYTQGNWSLGLHV